MDEGLGDSPGPADFGRYRLAIAVISLAVFLLFVGGATFAFKQQIKQMMHVNVEAEQNLMVGVDRTSR